MNLATLGLFRPAPAVIAPAPRSTTSRSVEEIAHVTRLLAALLNLEDSARFLETTPNFSGQLRQEISQLRRVGAGINARMLKEFTVEDAGAITTLNQCGNLLNRLSILLCHVPPEVAEDAANAAGDVVENWHSPKPKRKRGRPAKRISQPAH